jgi:segregation and condensation protein B
MDPFDVPLDVLRLAEAAVFASPEPMTIQRLAPLLPRDMDPSLVLSALEKHCASRGIILARAGDGWTFRTAPDLGPKLRELMAESRRLPRVAMETLVLIALHQPVTRAEVEDIRGVSLSQTTMDLLLESGLVKPWGRKEAPGRPTLWVTTPRFLTQFGLQSLRDLPTSQLTRGKPNRPQTSAAAPSEQVDGGRSGSDPAGGDVR